MQFSELIVYYWFSLFELFQFSINLMKLLNFKAEFVLFVLKCFNSHLVLSVFMMKIFINCAKLLDLTMILKLFDWK